MNSNKKALLLVLLFSFSVRADFFDFFNLKPKTQFDVVLGDEKNTELRALQLEFESFEKREGEYLHSIASEKIKIKSEIETVEDGLKKNPEDPFLNKKILILRSINQALSNGGTVWKEIISTTKEHITLLKNYIQDQDFNSLKLEKKSVYTIEDLQHLTDKISSEDDKITHFQSLKAEFQLGLDNKKKKLTSFERQLKEKQKEQADFVAQQKGGNEILSVHQMGQLLDLEVEQIRHEKEVAQLRVQSESSHLSLINSQIYMEEKKRALLKQKRDLMVRMSFKVDERDVKSAQQELEEKNRQYLTITDSYLQKIDKLSGEQDEAKKAFAQMEQEQKALVKDGTSLDEWNTQPGNADEYVLLSELGYRNDKILFVDREIDFIRSQIDLEKVSYEEKNIFSMIVSSWYKIKHQRFKSGEDLSKEIKKYEEKIAELTREHSLYEDKRNASTNRLNLQNKALANLKSIITQIQDKKRDIFSSAESRYAKCTNNFIKAQDLILQQIDITGQLIGNYSKILVSITSSMKHASTMLTELQQVSLWHRSGGAISKEGIAHIVPDFYAFVDDIRTLGFSYLSGVSISSMTKNAEKILKSPYALFLLLIRCLFLLFIFFFLRRYIPLLSRALLGVSKESMGQHIIAVLSASILLFLNQHLISIFLWVLFLVSFGLSSTADVYPSVLFFLLSIPYLLYVAHRFVGYLATFNADHGYLFFSENFEQHFFSILRIFLYSSVILLFFREAFILATYTKSELPNIILAFYGVIIRILLLALPRKEDLLGAISTKTPTWAWIWRLVDQYYYPALLFLILLMVLSDPNVGGYNNLVSYFLWGIIGTIVVIKVFYALYVFFRQATAAALFSSDGEKLQERFSFSKTFYGILVIVIFLFFLFLGTLVIAWFWGSSLSLQRVVDFMNAERLTIGIADGQFQKLSIFHLIKTAAFIPLGFLVAFIIDKFVLYRIFSVLLVNPGVHNAVSTISYYWIVVSVITIGLWQEGLGFLVVYYIGPLLLGLVWGLRDLFNDFFSYFVILINRPIKVGDYIKINEDVQGVVRSINPRSVVLRRKRGFCIIVPNHKMTQEVINNWDYHLNFISCPDILATVAYTANPEEVHKLLVAAVDATPSVLKSPASVIRLDNFNEYGFVFMVRCFISPEKTLDQWQIASDVRFNIVKKLRENGLSLAFPIRILKMQNEDLFEKQPKRSD